MPTTTAKTIKDIGLELSTKSRQTLVLDPVDLPDGRTLSDWASFVFTLREDPQWSEDHGGRFGANKNAGNWADPEDDGWTVVMSVSGIQVGDALEFTMTESDTDLEGGIKRYAGDVWGEGGVSGRVQFMVGDDEAAVFWVTMHARVRARS